MPTPENVVVARPTSASSGEVQLIDSVNYTICRTIRLPNAQISKKKSSKQGLMSLGGRRRCLQVVLKAPVGRRRRPWGR